MTAWFDRSRGSGKLAEALHRAAHGSGPVPPGFAVRDFGNGTRELVAVGRAPVPLVGAIRDDGRPGRQPAAPPRPPGPVHRADDPALIRQVVEAHNLAGRGSNQGFVILAQRGVPERVVAAICASRGLVWSRDDGRTYRDWVATA